jgi:hypothetical protein
MQRLLVFFFMQGASAMGSEVHFKKLEKILHRQAHPRHRVLVARTDFDRTADRWLSENLGIRPLEEKR